MRRCAVLGSPIAHSLSPVLHRAAYAHLGLDWEYTAVEVAEGELADFVSGLDHTWRGLSLTMPLKVEALAVADDVAKSARLIGAGNTLVVESGRRMVTNTDAPGLAAALRLHGVDAIDTALILGGGATARSSLVGLAALGARQISVAVRTAGRITDLTRIADELGVQVRAVEWQPAALPTADVCVSTVTAGAADDFADTVAERARVVFDVIYDPWPTRLAQVAAEAGRQVLGGLELLAGQAVLQVLAMTGERVPAEVLLRAGTAVLASGER